MPAELTIVVPTYNERDNINELIESIDVVLTGISWEIIFVDDDSPDKTSAVIRDLAQRDSHVRCLQRLHRRGLSSACIEGILSSSAPYIAVMDADGQHDECLLPDMLKQLRHKGLDLIIGSRYMSGGSMGELSTHRVWISRLATWIGGMSIHYPVTDPMSGFFMLRRSFFEKIMRHLSGKGFKILLDILISSREKIILEEIPYTMSERRHGESKLNTIVVWEFFYLIADKLLGKLLPVRFISFVAVGLSGVVVHLFTLWCLYKLMSVEFLFAQAFATLVAMTSNYVLNNHLTYRDKKLHGMNFIKGLFSFYLACSFGAVINIAIADLFYENAFPWWICGAIGAVAGAVWNFAATYVFTWGDVFRNGGKA